ncbi:amine oxidase catalytic domain-containing protein [Ophiobolus disseminans]|uniref:Amine oxidase n=1 Tax=Ophiobolus disseminans TaxID=1469910 RepID=A0A6A6ZKR6_9PLEO|nr:amine oxidase catalytic domain-containing protein [Ophiobolus disseminans]
MRLNRSLVLSSFVALQLVEVQGNGCSSTSQPSVVAPHVNPWKALSENESGAVNDLLQQKFNFTGNEGSRNSYVVRITLLSLNKTNVIDFLESGTKAPPRYARVTIQHGATNSTDMFRQEYAVGPLPATNSTSIAPLQYPFNNIQAGKTKVHPVYSPSDGASFLTKLSAEFEDITKELWNSTIVEGGIGVRIGTPFWSEEKRIITWAAFFSNPDPESVSSPTLLALGVSVRLDLTGRNWESWKATGWYSRGEYYSSTEDFRATVFSTGFVKPLPNIDGNWTSTDKQGEPIPFDDLPPPISISQGSQRFSIDVKENYVTWMDFAFYFAVSSDLGLSLFDIRYKDKRLLYELSLQEAFTHYAGSEPFASQAIFFDSETGFGTAIQPLVRGYDCPIHATYLNASFAEGTGTRMQADAICIFEHDAGYPIRRHSFSPAAPHTSVAKNIVFTIRTIATVGNYDFMIDYNFFYDGAIEVSARASGYISAAYWDGNLDYGFHIHDYLSGSLHDHVLAFKADIDILGTKNSVQKVEVIPTAATYPWSQGVVHNTFKASRSFVSNEVGVKWSENDAAIYAVVNKESPNRFGEFPGYRFKRSAGATHLTPSSSSNGQKAVGYATHDFYITKQKDTEPRAADAYNQFAPDDPLVDFSKFVDGEVIEQEDVVVWFNLGMHHMPHSGDLPNTMFTAAHSAMRFEPLNYLEGDPSVASNQQVRIDYNEDASVVFVEEFGKMKGMCG